MIDIRTVVEELNEENKWELQLSEDGQAVYASKDNVIDFLRTLKSKYDFKMLIDITAVDFQDGFEVVYHVMKFRNAEMLRIKVKLSADSLNIPTLTGIWKAADVMEREVFDLMGIRFEGHENLTRILCADDFTGHPLRKDYKLDMPSRF